MTFPRFVLLCLPAGVVLGCRDASPIVVGYAFPSQGYPNVALARDEIASTTAADERPIQIIYDSIGSGDPADVEVERAMYFAMLPRLAAVVGHGGSRGTLAAAPVYNAIGVPQVVPTSTSRLLRTAGPWTLVLAPDDSVEGAFLAGVAAARFAARRVTVFYVNDEYGSGLRDGVAGELARRGIVLAEAIPVTPESDLEPLVMLAIRERPDLVISAARSSATAQLVRLLHAGGHTVPVLAGDGALPIDNLAGAIGPGADSLYAVTFWSPWSTDLVSMAFVERFRRLFPGLEPSGTHAMSHDALMMVVAAIRDVGPRREGIRDWLLSLGRTRPPYRGVTGPITFLPDRPPRFEVIRLSGGRVVPVDPS